VRFLFLFWFSAVFRVFAFLGKFGYMDLRFGDRVEGFAGAAGLWVYPGRGGSRKAGVRCGSAGVTEEFFERGKFQLPISLKTSPPCSGGALCGGEVRSR
jgi:hypothetical protein